MDIAQAVILAGGLGTRLMPLTEGLPKPMVDVNGIPFLEHLILQLKANGIKKILLLTGHCKEKIEEYFANGNPWGIDIEYSRGPADWNTGRRLLRAYDLLQDHFFLLYGDNYYNYDLTRLKEHYLSQGRPLSMIITPKKTGNIRLNASNEIIAYDAERKMEGLTHVEIGFMIVDKSIVSMIDDSANPSFSNTIEKLANQQKVAGYLGQDVYHSISDLQRLEKTKEFLKDKKILLIDRDGTINEKAPRGRYITRAEDFTIIPEVFEALQKLAKSGYEFIVISNQAGVATGDLTEAELELIHKKMQQALMQRGIRIRGIYCSFAHWQNNKDFMRKPNPGLFFKVSKEHNLCLNKTFYIGDDPRDMEAAYNSNTRGIFYGDKTQIAGPSSTCLAFASRNMNDIADYILRGLD